MLGKSSQLPFLGSYKDLTERFVSNIKKICYVVKIDWPKERNIEHYINLVD